MPGYFDDACFLCGVTPSGPSSFTCEPDITAQELTDSLLEHFPDLLSAVPTCATREDLEAHLTAMFEKHEYEDLPGDLNATFRECIAIGYFGNHGDTPHEEIDDPIVMYRFPDGQFVTKRGVGDPSYGCFQRMYWEPDSDTEGYVGDVYMSETPSNTGAICLHGFGSFFLSRSCLGFLKGWIERASLPSMWDGRQLSFTGELWEIMNSRKTGRGIRGHLEWLKTGVAEFDETQDFLVAYDEVFPVKTAAALWSEYNEDRTLRAIYDDYGYWKFTSPHEWAEAPKSKDLVKLTALGFDLPLRISQASFTGYLPSLATEVLDQIFRHLPNVPTYLSLKLVSRRMNDLISDTKFTLPILREIIRPDPTGDMFWIYPLKNHPIELDNFKICLYSWFTLKCSSVEKESVTSLEILFHREFPLIEFIHSLYTSDFSRNRRRLWKNVKQFEEVWVDYRRNGWEVNRFGLPYPH